MNISLTDDLKAYVEERVTSGGYLTSSELCVSSFVRTWEDINSGSFSWWEERRRPPARRMTPISSG